LHEDSDYGSEYGAQQKKSKKLTNNDYMNLRGDESDAFSDDKEGDIK
jgi:hypothetical protein